MRLGIDVDGVLAQFNDAFAGRLAVLTGVDHIGGVARRADAFPCWAWPKHFGYSKAEENAAWESVKRDHSFWAILRPYPDAKDALILLRSLRQNGHDIYFITARPGEHAKLQTERWLMDHGMVVPTVLISSSKGTCSRGLRLDFYVDDRPENCLDTALFHDTKTYLVSREWNRDFVDENVRRVANLSEALAHYLGTMPVEEI